MVESAIWPFRGPPETGSKVKSRHRLLPQFSLSKLETGQEGARYESALQSQELREEIAMISWHAFHMWETGAAASPCAASYQGLEVEAQTCLAHK
jgi:hypothetical protein